ncbi:MAG: helix-turn-helix transcriptional regulator [Spirochaetaceae bacterium]|nr:helix-turn-helix transcriptional regulator [Spirochaetaceae bacterium]
MFRDNLKEQIEYKGMIIKELAAKTGISKRTIDTYVDSRAVIPNAEIAVKLAEALDTSVEYLVKGTETGRKLDVFPQKQVNYEKYKKILNELDLIPENFLPVIEAMLHAAAKKLSEKTEN